MNDLVDSAGLSKYLSDTLPSFSGPFTVERLGEGQSCLTFMIAGDGWRAVLRRPPRGDLPPTAFDVRREYRVMSALTNAGAPVPVPRPLILCEDTTVIGAPFYLMEPIEGVVVRNSLPAALSSVQDRRLMSEQLCDTLVDLQAVDWRAAGLEGFGKPEGYLARQLKRMTQLWELARFREIPSLEAVGAWLAENIPEQTGATIVHGDYKLDNVILAPTSPARLVAVVDWEMSTLGDPLCDLGWMLYFWREPSEEAFGLAVSTVMDMEGFPARRELLQRYATRRGVEAKNIEWYAALAGWKIAIIMEGSYRRFLAGVTDHPAFARLEEGVPYLADRAHAAMIGRLLN